MERLSTLNAIIKAHNLKIEEVAQKANITRAYMSFVLNGKRKMKKETLISFLEKMGYTHEQYLNLEEYKNLLEQTSMPDDEKWQLLLLQVLLIYFTNYNMHKSREQASQKSLGVKS